MFSMEGKLSTDEGEGSREREVSMHMIRREISISSGGNAAGLVIEAQSWCL